MIITVTLNPAVDRIVTLPELRLGDTNRITDGVLDPGGKGINVSRMVHELGSQSIAMGFIAGSLGRFIEESLGKRGIAVDFTHTPGDTRQNLAIIETSLHRHTILSEAGPPTDLKYLQRLRRAMERRLRPNDWVVLAGSVPPGIPHAVYADLTELAHAYRARVCLDADDGLLDLGVKAIPDLVKPNCQELERLVGRTLPDIAAIIQAANDLHADGIANVVVSLGRKGAIAVSDQGAWRVSPPAVRAISAIGSGDSLVAGLVLALSEGDSLATGLRLGTAAGAATALRPGTRLGTRADVERLEPLVILEPLRAARVAA